jgi:hypothetical protein
MYTFINKISTYKCDVTIVFLEVLNVYNNSHFDFLRCMIHKVWAFDVQIFKNIVWYSDSF